MQDSLLLILMGVGFFALYWVLFGQWKYNKIFNEELSEAERNIEVLRQKVYEYHAKEAKKKAKKNKKSK